MRETGQQSGAGPLRATALDGRAERSILGAMLRPVTRLGAVLAIGCGGGVEPDAAPPSAPREIGLVEMTLGGDVVVARAVFARVRDLDAGAAARLLGLRDDAWTASLVEDACAAADPSDDLDDALAAEAADVDLIEIGPLAVRAGGRAEPLAPQPIVLPFAAGLVYAADLPWLPDSEYTIEGADGRLLGVLPPPETRLAADPVLSARGLAVRWEAADGADRPAQIEIAWVRHGRGRLVRCLAADDGAFDLPPALLEGADGSTGTVAVAIERVRSAEAGGVRVRFASRSAAAAHVTGGKAR